MTGGVSSGDLGAVLHQRHIKSGSLSKTADIFLNYVLRYNHDNQPLSYANDTHMKLRLEFC